MTNEEYQQLEQQRREQWEDETRAGRIDYDIQVGRGRTYPDSERPER